jgi:hypothetical protein
VRVAGGGPKPAASGCGGAGRRSSPAGPKSRVSGHGWGRGGHLHDARELGDRSRPAARAKMRRRGRSPRRRGARTPARSQGWQGARGRRRVARARCSPPCAAPERFPGGGRTTAAGSRRRRRELELGFRRGRGVRGGGRRASRVGGPGGGGQLIRAWGGPLACAPRTGRRARAELGRRRRGRVLVGDERGGGDDVWAQAVSDSGRRGSGWRPKRLLGRLAGPGGWLAGPQGASGLE